MGIIFEYKKAMASEMLGKLLNNNSIPIKDVGEYVVNRSCDLKNFKLNNNSLKTFADMMINNKDKFADESSKSKNEYANKIKKNSKSEKKKEISNLEKDNE